MQLFMCLVDREKIPSVFYTFSKNWSKRECKWFPASLICRAPKAPKASKASKAPKASKASKALKAPKASTAFQASKKNV